MKVNKTKLKAVADKKGFNVKFDEKKEEIIIKPKDKSDDLLAKFSELLQQNQSLIESINKPDTIEKVDLKPLLNQFKHLISQNNAILSKMNEKPLFDEIEEVVVEPSLPKEWEAYVMRDDNGFINRFTLKEIIDVEY
jgi:hypothetical protein